MPTFVYVLIGIPCGVSIGLLANRLYIARTKRKIQVLKRDPRRARQIIDEDWSWPLR